ncbi:MAG: type II toxin-antitoxin system HicB family antitoxin [Terracidiphilus sp.]|jgi:predicted RNase H-like HicB family nuclease
MTREYMVVFEKGATNWSAFSPDVPGCGSMGDDLDETRSQMREALKAYLDDTFQAGEPLPEARNTKVDFEEFDPEYATKQYVVEWLSVDLPESISSSRQSRAA